MPNHREHTRHKSEGDREFSFWSSPNTTSTENGYDKVGSNEATRLSKEAEFEHSTFLSHTNHYCNVSDPSRSETIEKGRRELMEMVQDMPDESSYELSFQDMVIHEKHVQEQPDQNQTSLDNTHMHSSSNKSNKAQLKKQNNKKKNKNKSSRPDQILRVESMDSETFLLKMFFPTSLKKVKVEKGSSKVSRTPSSLKESVKQVDKEWRIKRFFQTGDNRRYTEDGMCGNTSSSNSSDKSRNFDRKLSFSSPGCWPLFHYAENKTKKLAE